MFSLNQAINWDNSLLDKSMLLISHAGKEIVKRHNLMAMGPWPHFSNIIYKLLVTWACRELALKIRKCAAENSRSIRRVDITNTHLSRFVLCLVLPCVVNRWEGCSGNLPCALPGACRSPGWKVLWFFSPFCCQPDFCPPAPLWWCNDS